MLKYFWENHLVHYSTKSIKNWEEAIQESCFSLLNQQLISQTYVDEIIQCVHEHGPYIVIVPHVAMPHSSENSTGVFGTAISFTKLKKEVLFPSEDEEKSASLFFTLAAKNPEEHMENIQKLSELLMTEGLIEDLLQTESLEEYQQLMKEYDL